MPIESAEVPAAVRGRRVAVLVGGGIAAYKVVDMVSQLAQGGCTVRVAMTAAAQRFVGATTFYGVSGQPVLTDLWSEEGHPEPHVELGDWAQVLLVAPATADLVAKLAHGLADDVVTATALAARAPVVVAPAMNDAMWAKPAVAANVAALRERGTVVVQPESGHLASGHQGAGRLAGATAVFAALEAAVGPGLDLAGRKVVVSAGGTREPIDPVRFIGNHSSGKMGFAMAEAAADRGAEVVLVSTAPYSGHGGIRLSPVETAAEMLEALRKEQRGAHLLVMAAAVADFRPARPQDHKIRREERSQGLVLELEKIDDLLSELAREPGAEGTYRLGFAAETEDLEARAEEKLRRKGLDAIVANDITRSDIGFGADDNEAVVFFRDGKRVELPKMSKRQMADQIIDLVVEDLK